MSDTAVEKKVDRLEELVMQVTYEHSKTEMELRSLSKEMKEFKNEMRIFKDEMRISKKENDRRWGDLVNKMGTLVEDIIAPSLPRIVKEDFGYPEIDDFMIRRRIRNKELSISEEFDAVVIAGDAIFINETKSRPSLEYVNDFLNKLKNVPDFFPEHTSKKIIPLFSSLYIPEHVLNYLTKNKIYALGMGDDVIEVLNLDDINK